MLVEFDKKYLKELYLDGKTSDKSHRFQPQIIRLYRMRIEFIMAAKNIRELCRINGLHYKVLEGDKAGTSAVRLNKKYRLEFLVKEIDGDEKITICDMQDITNHYKD